MNRILLLILTILLLLRSIPGEGQGHYWIAFTDKNNTTYSLNDPLDYLSDRAISRRIRQNIAIDSLDLPVNKVYIDSVLSGGAQLIHTSKWLNGVTVFTEAEGYKDWVSKFSFVNNVQLSKPLITEKSAQSKFVENAIQKKATIDTSEYGPSVYQTGLMNGQFLHNKGYKGEGIHIAVLDGGFSHANEYTAFDSLWANNQILGTRDFVDPGSDIFDTDSHGMSVLSCIGGNIPGELIGTATKASFWLLRSEDGDIHSEYIIEEDNWVVAAEFADSVGADIINSSLGYFLFKDTATSHTYSDMDGKTTRVTRGANIAASKGMLVFSSAGNEGNKDWKYIIAPSDGDNVIGVGAVNKFGFAAYFTSFGPASDGDVKPNLSAVGMNTYLQLSTGDLGYSNGTSFSSPVLAGMAACLWQAHPYATAYEIKEALEKSASLYNEPDSLLGYGIPDMELASTMLGPLKAEKRKRTDIWSVFPNPVGEYLVIKSNGAMQFETLDIELYNLEGRLLRKWRKRDNSRIVLNGFRSLRNGMYVLRLTTESSTQPIKIIKQDQL